MNDNDAEIRRLLDDVAAGRISASDAEWQIKNLTPTDEPAVSSTTNPTTSSKPALASPSHGRNSFPWPAALLMALIGSVFLGIGFYTGHKTLDFVSNGVKTEGLVVRMVRSKKNSKPEVKYSVNGQEFQITGEISSSPPAFHVGERVEILYKPNNPADGVINSFSERWLFPSIFGGIGVVVGLAGWGILLVKLLSKLFGGWRSSRDDERFTIEP